jgi:VanZ family protein
MGIFFTILSIAYIAGIFLWADSPIVEELSAFNPYSLLHIPLYGILTILLILSRLRFSFVNEKNQRNLPREMPSLFHRGQINQVKVEDKLKVKVEVQRNQTNQINQIDQRNQRDSTSPINLMNQMKVKVKVEVKENPNNASNPSNSIAEPKAEVKVKNNQTNQINQIDQRNQTDQRNLLMAGLIAFIVAIADEIHQAFIPGRNASVIDVLLDLVGIVVVLIVVHQTKRKNQDGHPQKTVLSLRKKFWR